LPEVVTILVTGNKDGYKYKSSHTTEWHHCWFTAVCGSTVEANQNNLTDNTVFKQCLQNFGWKFVTEILGSIPKTFNSYGQSEKAFSTIHKSYLLKEKVQFWKCSFTVNCTIFRMYYYILKTVQYHSVQCYLLLVKIFCVLVDPSSHLAFSTKGV